ncbi:hypothetical protein D9611_012590 [Ephemerocybe angulata]|uniref:Uncharacterized protein n=1 Tax=Ephemerocybe angulata TaxID=980116 RepID=A0A8H5AUS5_9AGAR|nr:hypothetical protein D9611_012590 [Tulosesus angulatus]
MRSQRLISFPSWTRERVVQTLNRKGELEIGDSEGLARGRCGARCQVWPDVKANVLRLRRTRVIREWVVEVANPNIP